MNNTKNILLLAIITATLVMGTSVIPMQSYADRDNNDHKKTKDFKSSITASAESDKESSSQHQDQDNFCYRGDNDCEQANQGQQIVGKDNDAKGFNDQSDNLALSTLGAGAGNGNGNGNGTGTGNGTKTKTCEECFATAFASLSTDVQLKIIDALGGSGTIASLCDLQSISGPLLTDILERAQLPEATITALIQCLLAAGVNVTGLDE